MGAPTCNIVSEARYWANVRLNLRFAAVERAALAIVAGAFLSSSIALASAPALARSSYVQDGAGMLSSTTVDQLNTEIGAFNARTGKEVVVVTVPSLNGSTLADAMSQTFRNDAVNGVLIFIAKAERKGGVVGDVASRAFFPPGSFRNIYDAMLGYFRTGDFDKGVETGVGLVITEYESHSRGRTSGAAVPVDRPVALATPVPEKKSFGGLGLFWFIVLLLVGFFVIRAIFRAMSGPRNYGPGPGMMGGGPPMGGGPGYGPGYGGGAGFGGGGFFSGLLGGLGGAWIGNQLFGRNETIMEPAQAGTVLPDSGADASGWQSDPGQADMGNMAGGDFGGGGGDWGGGGGDAGGGGGGDW